MKKILRGTIISKPEEHTAVLQVEVMKKHPKYGKRIRRHNKFYVHDLEGESRKNDYVEVEESRPYSKTKRWLLVKVIKKGENN